MKIAIPKEQHRNENRVSLTPQGVGELVERGFEVCVEAGAGLNATLKDQDYVDAGATIGKTVGDTYAGADLVLKVHMPSTNNLTGTDEVALLPKGSVVISLVNPAQNSDGIKALSNREATLIALDCIPRITRAQKMDVLSSMANIAGYRAVIEASSHYGRFLGGQITAAGSTPPAKVLIVGAGVAGLAAAGAARSLGAEVRAFDVRAAAKEEVESLGASFLQVTIEESGEGSGGYAKTMSKEFIDAEMALFREQAKEVDIIITTALIPGKGAPRLILKDMIESMRAGSVLVDLAAEGGGNCELTIPGKKVVHNGVTILGYTDLTSRMPAHSSQFFGQNILHLLKEMGDGDSFSVDLDNEIIRQSIILHTGELMWPPPKVEAPPPPPSPTPKVVKSKPEVLPVAPSRGLLDRARSAGLSVVLIAGLIGAVGAVTPPEFVAHFTVFVLACFIGWQVVWSVSAALHTPLMSVTNAISGIILIGGLLQAGALGTDSLALLLGTIAVFFASINVVGGFLVTQRMLVMFRAEGE
jgi:NAD(P) transhydrogenase subunit alpha